MFAEKMCAALGLEAVGFLMWKEQAMERGWSSRRVRLHAPHLSMRVGSCPPRTGPTFSAVPGEPKEAMVPVLRACVYWDCPVAMVI